MKRPVFFVSLMPIIIVLVIFKIFAFLLTNGILQLMNFLLSDVISLARQAGDQVLKVYRSDFTVEFKADKSPLTAADLASHYCICQGLQCLTPDLPIISEESTSISFAERRLWSRYWLIDPLDGTKEFLEKNDEFTINIALIDRHKPILGIVFAPALDVCYFAESAQGAFKQIAQNPPEPLNSGAWQEGSAITAVVSRRHGMNELRVFLAQFAHLNLLYCGSALKFCFVAEGLADIYPRFSPTFEWDTAAGQCILEQAGGAVIDYKGKLLRYNRSSSLRKAAFLAVADKSHRWLNYLKPSS
ncbi:MAG: 3(2) 5-bisphosphate nucleotidase [Pseudomonadota bacterium]|jgi:3'(2'), 5'-bisphosphate nucleotidase